MPVPGQGGESGAGLGALWQAQACCRPSSSRVFPSICSFFLPVSLPSLGSHAPMAELGAPGVSGRGTLGVLGGGQQG